VAQRRAAAVLILGPCPALAGAAAGVYWATTRSWRRRRRGLMMTVVMDKLRQKLGTTSGELLLGFFG
jgi:hypothetical protein